MLSHFECYMRLRRNQSCEIPGALAHELYDLFLNNTLYNDVDPEDVSYINIRSIVLIFYLLSTLAVVSMIARIQWSLFVQKIILLFKFIVYVGFLYMFKILLQDKGYSLVSVLTHIP